VPLEAPNGLSPTQATDCEPIFGPRLRAQGDLPPIQKTRTSRLCVYERESIEHVHRDKVFNGALRFSAPVRRRHEHELRNHFVYHVREVSCCAFRKGVDQIIKV
jgi:hypothetical protein